MSLFSEVLYDIELIAEEKEKEQLKIKNILPYVCTTCGSRFINWYELTYHLRDHYPYGYPYLCRSCGKRYKNIASRNRHHREIHGIYKNKKDGYK